MIDELLKLRKTGIQYPDRDPAVHASISREDKGETEIQPLSFGVQHEYELSLKVGVNFVANSAQIEDKERHAIKQLKHALYDDMISDIYEALNVCDDIQTQKILNRMLNKIYD